MVSVLTLATGTETHACAPARSDLSELDPGGNSTVAGAGDDPMGAGDRGRPISSGAGGKPMAFGVGGRPISTGFGGKPMGLGAGGRPISAGRGGNCACATTVKTEASTSTASAINEPIRKITFSMPVEVHEIPMHDQKVVLGRVLLPIRDFSRLTC